MLRGLKICLPGRRAIYIPNGSNVLKILMVKLEVGDLVGAWGSVAVKVG